MKSHFRVLLHSHSVTNHKRLFAHTALIHKSHCSSDPTKPLLVTSPVFYVNADPHVGHLHSAVLCDTMKRWLELQGHVVHLSIGTDEHGIKIQEAAQAKSQQPKPFCDVISQRFRALFEKANISFTDFIRTTEQRHYTAVSHLWKTLLQNGFIYKGFHEGWYCVSDETFYPASQIHTISLSNGMEQHTTKDTGKRVEWTREENYKFKLSHFKADILAWLLDNPNAIIPKSRYNDVLASLSPTHEEYHTDLSISRPRSRLQWGIPVPNDPDHVMYVWMDALTNYLTVCGYPSSSPSANAWPAHCHVIGKDIVKFHCVHWPAFLLAAKLELPKHIVAHGHWISNGQKMSKSIGNVVDPFSLMDEFGVDTVRYFLMRDGSIADDAEFSKELVEMRYRTDLGNKLGNLILRCASTSLNTLQTIPAKPSTCTSYDNEMKAALIQFPDDFKKFMDKDQVNLALECAFTLISQANIYIQTTKPWVLLKKGDKERVTSVLYYAFEAMRIVGILCSIAMPVKMDDLLTVLMVDKSQRRWEDCRLGALSEQGDRSLPSEIPILFPKKNK